MNYRIHITKTAERDVNRAVDHIEFSLKNPQAAERLMDATEHEIMSLATMPERYALVDDPLLAAWGIRFVQINNYLAFYMSHLLICLCHYAIFLSCTWFFS